MASRRSGGSAGGSGGALDTLFVEIEVRTQQMVQQLNQALSHATQMAQQGGQNAGNAYSQAFIGSINLTQNLNTQMTQALSHAQQAAAQGGQQVGQSVNTGFSNALQLQVAQPLQAATQAAHNTAQQGGQQVGGRFSDAFQGAMGVAFAAVGTLTAALGAVGAAGFIAAKDTGEAMRRIQASLGVTADEAKKLAETAAQTWGDNWGDSIGDITTDLIALKQQVKGLGDDELRSVTGKLNAISDNFGKETTELIGPLNTLMKQFGLTSEQALDFLAKGFQRGLNGSDDFLDTIGEYSTQFKNGGATAEEFFSVLETGFAGGVLGTDKAGDAFKEFRVRIQDGSATTSAGLQQLGIDATELGNRMKDGSVTAADAFKLVLSKLSETKDQNTKMQAGVALLGTQYEDLGQGIVDAMSLGKTSLKDMAGATDGLNVRYNTLGSALEGVKRQGMLAFRPIGDEILKLANQAIPYVTKAFDWFKINIPPIINSVVTSFQGLGKNIGSIMDAAKPYINAVIPVIESLGKAFGSLWDLLKTAWEKVGKPVLDALAPLFKASFGAVAGLVKTALDGVTGIIAIFSSALKGDWKAVWDGLVKTVSNIGTGLGEAFKKVLDGVLDIMLNIGPQLYKIGSGWIDQLKAGVSSGFDKFKGWAKDNLTLEGLFLKDQGFSLSELDKQLTPGKTVQNSPQRIGGAYTGLGQGGASGSVSRGTETPKTTGKPENYSSFVDALGGDISVFLLQKLGAHPEKYSKTGGRGHPGIDYEIGQGPNGGKLGAGVYAPDAFDGAKVVRADNKKSGYGNSIELQLTNGYKVLLGHFQKLGVEAGQTIAKGMLLGAQGNTGWGFGPKGSGEGQGPVHLHVEVRDGKGGIVYDPKKYQSVLSGSQPKDVTTNTTKAVTSSAPVATPRTDAATAALSKSVAVSGITKSIQQLVPEAEKLQKALSDAEKSGDGVGWVKAKAALDEFGKSSTEAGQAITVASMNAARLTTVTDGTTAAITALADAEKDKQSQIDDGRKTIQQAMATDAFSKALRLNTKEQLNAKLAQAQRDGDSSRGVAIYGELKRRQEVLDEQKKQSVEKDKANLAASGSFLTKYGEQLGDFFQTTLKDNGPKQIILGVQRTAEEALGTVGDLIDANTEASKTALKAKSDADKLASGGKGDNSHDSSTADPQAPTRALNELKGQTGFAVEMILGDMAEVDDSFDRAGKSAGKLADPVRVSLGTLRDMLVSTMQPLDEFEQAVGDLYKEGKISAEDYKQITEDIATQKAPPADNGLLPQLLEVNKQLEITRKNYQDNPLSFSVDNKDIIDLQNNINALGEAYGNLPDILDIQRDVTEMIQTAGDNVKTIMSEVGDDVTDGMDEVTDATDRAARSAGLLPDDYKVSLSTLRGLLTDTLTPLDVLEKAFADLFNDGKISAEDYKQILEDIATQKIPDTKSEQGANAALAVNKLYEEAKKKYADDPFNFSLDNSDLTELKTQLAILNKDFGDVVDVKELTADINDWMDVANLGVSQVIDGVEKRYKRPIIGTEAKPRERSLEVGSEAARPDLKVPKVKQADLSDAGRTGTGQLEKVSDKVQDLSHQFDIGAISGSELTKAITNLNDELGKIDPNLLNDQQEKTLANLGIQLTNLGDTAKEIAEGDAAASINEMGARLQEGVDNQVSAISDRVETLTDQLDKGQISIQDFGEESDRIKTQINLILADDTLDKDSVNFLEGFLDALDKADVDAKTKIDKLKTDIKERSKQIGDALINAGNSFEAGMGVWSDVLKTGLNTVGNYFSSDASTEGGKVLDGISGFVASIGSIFGSGKDYAEQAIGKFVTGVQNALSSLAKGDWIGAIIGGVTTVVNGIVSVVNGASESLAKSQKEVKDTIDSFKFVDVSNLIETNTHYTGGWKDIFGPVSETTFSEVGLAIARTFEDGVSNGLKSGMKGFLNGDADWMTSIGDAMRDTIQDAIIQAVVEGGIIQGLLAPILGRLASAVAIGDKGAIASAIGELKAIMPQVEGLVTDALGPIKTIIDDAFPKSATTDTKGTATAGSIDAMNAELADLRDKYAAAATNSERAVISQSIKDLEKRIASVDVLNAKDDAEKDEYKFGDILPGVNIIQSLEKKIKDLKQQFKDALTFDDKKQIQGDLDTYTARLNEIKGKAVDAMPEVMPNSIMDNAIRPLGSNIMDNAIRGPSGVDLTPPGVNPKGLAVVNPTATFGSYVDGFGVHVGAFGKFIDQALKMILQPQSQLGQSKDWSVIAKR